MKETPMACKGGPADNPRLKDDGRILGVCPTCGCWNVRVKKDGTTYTHQPIVRMSAGSVPPRAVRSAT